VKNTCLAEKIIQFVLVRNGLKNSYLYIIHRNEITRFLHNCPTSLWQPKTISNDINEYQPTR